MKKFLALMLVLLSAQGAFAAAAFDQQKNLGKDRAGLQWWLVGYGSADSGYYAVAREYYTNADVKAEFVKTLSSRYGVPDDRAKALYFTEYRFEYSSDGKQCAEISRVLYDMVGKEIYAYRAADKVFSPVKPNTVHSKGAAYAMGKIK